MMKHTVGEILAAGVGHVEGVEEGVGWVGLRLLEVLTVEG
jgi:hypothetical protein